LSVQCGKAFECYMVETSPTEWTMNYITQEQVNRTQTVADNLVLSTQDVNQQLVRTFSLHRDVLLRANMFATEALNLERQQLISKYNATTRQKLAFLTEQAEIARTINLDVGTLTSYINIVNNFNVVTDNDTDIVIDIADSSIEAKGETAVKTISNEGSSAGTKAAYLRGYIAIDKEIELIKARDYEVFIPDLNRIDLLKSELVKVKSIKTLESLLANTPIGTDQFVAATYNLDTLVYKNRTKTILIVALSIVLGGMLGIFVLFIKNALAKKD